MHYKDGTEAKVGDLVWGTTHGGVDPVAGYVLTLQPGSDTCNMNLAVLRPVSDLASYWGACLSIGIRDSPSEGQAPVARLHAMAGTELANCKDCTLLFRPRDTREASR